MRGPFLRSPQSTSHLMAQVVVALLPIATIAIWRHGAPAAVTLGGAVTAALAVEIAVRRAAPRDLSAVITGMLAALLLPADAPPWLGAAAGALAIGVGKHAFGGLGKNPFNPAALSRGLLMVLVPATLFAPAWAWDGVTMASPLARESGGTAPLLSAVWSGDVPGALGTSAPWAVLLGGLALVALRTIDGRVPLVYLATVTVGSIVLPGSDRIVAHAPWLVADPLLHLLAGGTLLTAFFLLTDPVTAPFAPLGRVAFAAIAGVVTIAARLYTPYPDAAALAVLVANAFTPAIDRWRST